MGAAREQSEQEAPSRVQVWAMFDRIAHRYDLLNRSLSFGQDQRWRCRLARYLPDRPDLRLVDLATGTADQLLRLAKDPRIINGLGLDLAEKMLAIGREKIERAGLSDKLKLDIGDATALPLPDACADVVTVAFGIRNVESVPKGLAEIRRILKPAGRVLILEFGLPRCALIRCSYLWYFRHILPRIGGWISGDAHAYRYLNRTVESFPYGADFCALLEQAGFRAVRAHPLTFGVAFIYQGDRE